MPALHAVHTVDPRKEIVKKIGKQLDQVKLFGNHILVAVYERPKTAQYGTLTLDLPDATRGEDKYQGKVGLVVALGPQAYVDDEQTQFHGQKVEEGDWVVFKPSDGWQVTLTGGQVLCRVLVESQIRMKIGSPDAVW